MEIRAWYLYFFLTVALMLIHESSVSASYFAPYNVSYDHRAIIIGGNRRMLISAGIHYPRATPQMWPGLIAKSKEGGADLIQTYVFWNGHEPIRGQYNFEERYDLVKFAKLIASNGLYLHLRIGPYVCAEWNFGGFPVWLRDVPGIEFRTNNAAYKAAMEKFVKKIVDLMKQEMLFSWQGGPIILLQIENEYGNIEGKYGQGGKEYIKWAGNMALGLGANVPWVMCKQTDAPENIIDACNGFYCDGYKPNSYMKPSIWTEDWNGWFANWGERVPHRPVEDNAFAVARFFQRGGSYHNYYMYFGGTNFERTAGGPLQSTSYDYDAPIDEYGLLSQPKWGHLKDLHSAIKLCEPALVAVDDAPQYVKLGPMQEADIYSTSHIPTNSKLPKNINICSAFLANIDEHKSVDVNIFGEVYTLPPWSVSILPDCKQVAFNTAKVGAQVSLKSWESDSSPNGSKAGLLSKQNNEIHISKNWMYFKEPVGAWGDNAFTSKGILEHLNVTKDATDYLWYITRYFKEPVGAWGDNAFTSKGILEHLNVTKDATDYLCYITRIDVTAEDISFWEEKSVRPSLIIDSMRDVVRVFVNGHLAGSTHGKWVKVSLPVYLDQGSNELALVSETVGLQNYGAFLEKDGAGFRGQVKLIDTKAGEIDLSTSLWTYQVGLKGEFKRFYAIEEQENAEWTDLKLDALPTTFTWYKNYFDAPEGNDTVSLDLGSMSKGQAWVNGHGIGRFWSLIAPHDGCPETCNYFGTYNENKCATNCGKPTQTRYHIPREWLQASNNLLVLFDEEGGNPSQISVKTHSTKIVCARVSETHYPPLSAWSLPKFANGSISIDKSAPEVHLHCDDGQKISSVTFASYGNPSGSCQQFSVGKCHAQHSLSVVSEACQGRNSCSISVSNEKFGQDPCHGIVKTLAVQAECISDTDVNYAISSL